MDIPDPKKFLGWRDLYRKFPSWLKVILLITIIVIAIICFYLHFFGPVPKLKEENAGLEVKLADAEYDKSRLRDQIAGLEENLAEAESEKSRLRDRKDELHRENLQLKTITVPVQEMLKQLYPKMETAAAIARLAEDVKTVRHLATRDVYKPLAIQKKKELIAKLQALLGRFTSFTHTVTISYQQVIPSHRKVVNDLEQYLEEAGFEVKIGTILSDTGRNPPNLSIKFHPDDEEFVRQFVAALYPLYINEQFQGLTQEKISRGCFEIKINGDPSFTELGVVEFQ